MGGFARAHELDASSAAGSSHASEGSTLSSRAGQRGSHQFQRPRHRDDRRDEHAANDGRVEQDAGGKRGGEHLDLRSGARGSARRTRGPRINAALVTRRPGAADPLDDRRLGRAGAVVFLPHPAEDEDLVVHREPEEEGEDDRAGISALIAVRRARCPRSRRSRWPFCQTSTITPHAARDREHVQEHAP